LVFHLSTIAMMHGPINIRRLSFLHHTSHFNMVKYLSSLSPNAVW